MLKVVCANSHHYNQSLFSSAYAGIVMYHVSNKLRAAKDHQPPRWTEIELNVADDETYDHKLVNLPLACFTTTLYKGDLPTISPYPRQARSEDVHWRVRMPFRPNEYKIFEMPPSNFNTTQVHLLCLDKADNYTRHYEKVLVEILNETKEFKFRSYKDLEQSKYFPGGQANDSGSKLWVNVCFIAPVQISDDAKWDWVERGTQRYGTLTQVDAESDNVDKIKGWGEKRLNLVQDIHRRNELEKKWEASVEQLKLMVLIKRLAMKWWA